MSESLTSQWRVTKQAVRGKGVGVARNWKAPQVGAEVLRKGEVKHGDSLGHKGSIGAGDIQWMTSGSGILHEEMPQVRPEGIAGLQIWLNLPARDKMGRPKYRDLQSDRLAETKTQDGASIRVIAGEAQGGKFAGPVEGLAVAPKFIDVTLPPGQSKPPFSPRVRRRDRRHRRRDIEHSA